MDVFLLYVYGFGSLPKSSGKFVRPGEALPRLRPPLLFFCAQTGFRRFLRPNSKRVTVASKFVSTHNSFCSVVVFLAYLHAYKKIFRFRRVSLSGWSLRGTSILQSVPRWAQNSSARDRDRQNPVPLGFKPGQVSGPSSSWI